MQHDPLLLVMHSGSEIWWRIQGFHFFRWILFFPSVSDATCFDFFKVSIASFFITWHFAQWVNNSPIKPVFLDYFVFFFCLILKSLRWLRSIEAQFCLLFMVMVTKMLKIQKLKPCRLLRLRGFLSFLDNYMFTWTDFRLFFVHFWNTTPHFNRAIQASQSTVGHFA